MGKMDSTKMSKPHLSKSSYYRILLIVLVIWLGIVSFLAYVGFEFWAKFVPMVTGLIVTLLFFHYFFDRIEEFEKNQELEKLRNTIGSRIYSIFQTLVSLCDVDSVLTGEETEDAWKALWNRQLTELASKVTLYKGVGYLWEDRELLSSMSSLFDDERSILIETVRRYEEKVSKETVSTRQRLSFIHLERLLKDLSFKLLTKRENKEEYEQAISDLIQKIMKEILGLRNSGIAIGF
jgi:hypothetical protein